MIIFTPAELRSLAAKCRAEAQRIEKGPISIFAADAVFDENSQAARYERDASELETAIAACDRNTAGNIEALKVAANESFNVLQKADTAWNRAFAQRLPYEVELAAYHEARSAYWTAIAKLLVAMGEV